MFTRRFVPGPMAKDVFFVEGWRAGDGCFHVSMAMFFFGVGTMLRIVS